jgi:hypothetical protein
MDVHPWHKNSADHVWRVVLDFSGRIGERPTCCQISFCCEVIDGVGQVVDVRNGFAIDAEPALAVRTELPDTFNTSIEEAPVGVPIADLMFVALDDVVVLRGEDKRLSNHK